MWRIPKTSHTPGGTRNPGWEPESYSNELWYCTRKSIQLKKIYTDFFLFAYQT